MFLVCFSPDSHPAGASRPPEDEAELAACLTAAPVCGGPSLRAAGRRVTAANTPAAVTVETCLCWEDETAAVSETSGSTAWVRAASPSRHLGSLT